MKKKNILFVQDHLILGGAAKAALRMRSVCQDLGHETLSIHGDKAELNQWPSYTIHGKSGLVGKLWERLFGEVPGDQLRKVRAITGLRQFLQRNPQDLIWFQNIAGAEKWGWSCNWIREAVNHAPVIITMHDMFYLGVKESYVWDQPVEPTKFAGLEMKELKDLIQAKKLFVNAPSDWLRELAMSLYGIDAGKMLVPLLPEQLPALRLIHGSGLLQKTNSQVLCLGRNLPGDLCSDRIISLGHVENPEAYRKLFDRVHFLFHPSLIDNFPLIIQDSLALGCPVVALDRGGVDESVRNGITGSLLPEMTRETLEKVFVENAKMSPESYGRLSQSCLDFAQTNYSEESLKPVYANYLSGVCLN
ncbi:MAG: glycosyltransferase [Actinobacteria bacterium]|nr:glycosyltransferase [Actinomycetota bacterium]